MEITQELKDQITSLLNTIESQKTSFTELVQINKAASKDNDRLREELENVRSNREHISVESRELKTQLESMSIRLQKYRRTTGVNL